VLPMLLRRPIVTRLAIALSLFPLLAAARGGTAPPGSVRTERSPHPLLLTQATDQESWKALEAEQARRRRAREQMPIPVDPTPKLKPKAESPRSRTSAAKEGTTRPSAPQSRRPAVMTSPPLRRRPGTNFRVDANSSEETSPKPNRTSSCYAAVGIQTDASGRPLRDVGALADERSQEAFIRCLDSR
jgi:hypothetical protein